MITTYPPQTSSRFAASQWLCAMHNNVNQRLGKPIFECSNIEAKYPCGCAEEEDVDDESSTTDKKKSSALK